MRILCLLTVFVATAAGATENISIRNSILAGLEQSYQENYDSAGGYFKTAIEQDPNDPSGYFFLCGMYGLYMNDFSTDEMDGLFLINLFQSIGAARRRIDIDSLDAWAHFYLGGAYAYRAFREQQRGSKWAALGYALTAVDELKRCVSIDRTIYDAYMGIGSYHYFVNYLWSYIPFLGRDPGRGIREIRLAMEKGTFVNVAAQEGLIHILLREKKYEDALELADNLVTRYPSSRTFKWTLGKVYEEMENWTGAVRVYRELLEMIEIGQPENYYNLAYCSHRLAYSLHRSGERDEASELCLRSLDILKNPSEKREAKELREDLKALLAEIKKTSTE